METKPKLLIGSPMCWAFSIVQSLNHKRMGEQKYQAMLEHGRTHQQFVCELYAIQHQGNRYFLHEHPASAPSWNEECID